MINPRMTIVVYGARRIGRTTMLQKVLLPALKKAGYLVYEIPAPADTAHRYLADSIALEATAPGMGEYL